jgi:hypothetical protein
VEGAGNLAPQPGSDLCGRVVAGETTNNIPGTIGASGRAGSNPLIIQEMLDDM